MARPSVALLSRRKIATEALAVVDEAGVDGFNVRRLAERLDVNPASLYHHFSGKDEILSGCVRLALADLMEFEPPTQAADLPGWLADQGLAFRRDVLAHPNILPLFITRYPASVTPRRFQQMVEVTAELTDLSRAQALEMGELVLSALLGVLVMEVSAPSAGDDDSWRTKAPDVAAGFDALQAETDVREHGLAVTIRTIAEAYLRGAYLR